MIRDRLKFHKLSFLGLGSPPKGRTPLESTVLIHIRPRSLVICLSLWRKTREGPYPSKKSESLSESGRCGTQASKAGSLHC